MTINNRAWATACCMICLTTALAGKGFFPAYQWTVAQCAPLLALFVGLAILFSCSKDTTLRYDKLDAGILGLVLWCMISDVYNETWSGYRCLIQIGWVGFFCLIRRLKPCPHTSHLIVAVLTVLCSIHAILHYAGLLPAPLFNNSSGYAAALAIGLPSIIVLFDHGSPRRGVSMRRVACTAGAALACGAVILSGSRTAWIALVMAVLAMTWQKIRGRLSVTARRTLWLFCPLTILGCILTLYPMRPESANGRMLIYQAALRCIGQDPAMGHGSMGILRDYMPAQAQILSLRPDHPYRFLAGNSPFVFNEWIGFTLKYGLIGLALLVTLLAVYIMRAKRAKRLYFLPHAWAYLGMSLFSYPTAHPYLVFLGLCMLGCMVSYEDNSSYVVKISGGVRGLLCTLSIAGLPMIIWRLNGERIWMTASRSADVGNYSAALPAYRSAFGTLNDRPDFLYNYAATLNASGDFTQSEKIRERGMRLLNDCDMQLLAADNMMALHQWREALPHLNLAHEMVPSRFMPLYGLMVSYTELGEKEKAQLIAQEIIRMPIKVPSMEVKEIKEAAQGELSRLDKEG